MDVASEPDVWDPRWETEPMPPPPGIRPLGGPPVCHGQLVVGRLGRLYVAARGNIYSRTGGLLAYEWACPASGTWELLWWHPATPVDVQEAQLSQLTGGGL
jgi:hypothetical protein